jgi:hypothetical protein
MDSDRNAIAQAAAQIRTGHWRSAINLRRIKKRSNDKCRFCDGKSLDDEVPRRIPLPQRYAGGSEGQAWERMNPGGIRVLLSNLGRQGRLLRFLEISEVGRFVDGGVDEDEAMHPGWMTGLYGRRERGGNARCNGFLELGLPSRCFLRM